MSETAPALNIVHLDTGGELRGGQRQLLLLARELRLRGHRQRIVCAEGSALEGRAGAEGFPGLSLPAHDPWHAHGIVQLRQHLQIEPADILHAHDGKGHTVGWLASLGMPVKRVASRRVTFLPTRRLDYRLKYGRTCDGVIAVSEFVRGLVVASGIPAAKVEVIPDGVEIPEQVPDAQARRQARARWNFQEDDFVIGQLGAFTPEKGQSLAVEAVAQLETKIPRARLFLAGEGPLLSSGDFAKRLARAGARVRLERYVESLWDYFAALDLFVMPSLSEGLGSSVLLAMAHGLPVVASRVGGLPEIVQPNSTGWLVEPNSAGALAQGILEAFADPARRREFGWQGREGASGFSSKIMAERTEDFYRRTLGCGPA
jgi:glycosyltransferase involved in cell wall biosynthesis